MGFEKGFSDQRAEIVLDSLEVEGTLRKTTGKDFT